jgi:hypothetical protein
VGRKQEQQPARQILGGLGLDRTSGDPPIRGQGDIGDYREKPIEHIEETRRVWIRRQYWQRR